VIEVTGTSYFERQVTIPQELDVGHTNESIEDSNELLDLNFEAKRLGMYQLACFQV
jgi:hypothetical protein